MKPLKQHNLIVESGVLRSAVQDSIYTDKWRKKAVAGLKDIPPLSRPYNYAEIVDVTVDGKEDVLGIVNIHWFDLIKYDHEALLDTLSDKLVDTGLLMDIYHLPISVSPLGHYIRFLVWGDATEVLSMIREEESHD